MAGSIDKITDAKRNAIMAKHKAQRETGWLEMEEPILRALAQAGLLERTWIEAIEAEENPMQNREFTNQMYVLINDLADEVRKIYRAHSGTDVKRLQ